MGNTKKRTKKSQEKVKKLGYQEETAHNNGENYKFTDDETHLSCGWDLGKFLKCMRNLKITFENLGWKAVDSYCRSYSC